MTLNRLILALVLLGIAAVALYQILPFVFGRQWTVLYGEAAAALILVVPLGTVLVRRLRTLGHSAFWSLLVLLPVFVAAAGQIAFWQVFFSGHQPSVLLNLVRENVFRLSDTWVPVVLGLAGLIAALLIYKLVLPKAPRSA